MTIEIRQPELEALIHQHMASGHFRSVEDLLKQTLEAAPLTDPLEKESRSMQTGLELLEAMQAMPYKDADIAPYRPKMPVRDVEL